MIHLLGEYDCKVDAKGRFMLPAGLKKQLNEVAHEGFVVNRDIFDNCLILYPNKVWSDVNDQLNTLNRFVRKNVQFIRKFINGATRLELDSTGRLLLPKSLMDFAGVKNEIKVCGNGDRVEIWSKKNYEKMLKEEVDFAALSEEVMGNVRQNDE